MATLQDAIAAIQTEALAMTGIMAAPAYMPGQAPAGPFVITAPATGSLGFQDGWIQGEHVVACHILMPRLDLGLAISVLIPYIEVFFKRLVANKTLTGNVEWVSRVTYEWVYSFAYNGVEHCGPRFDISFSQEASST